jgi:Protein of unknown function (DUF3168)
MAESAALALQVAMRARLLAHAPLTALLGGPNVHDHAPQGGALPYVVFAEIETRDEGTQSWPTAEHAVTLHAWSQAEGVKEVRALLAEIDAALTGAALTLTGHRLVDLRSVLTVAARIDGVRRRGLIRFRAVTEPL